MIKLLLIFFFLTFQPITSVFTADNNSPGSGFNPQIPVKLHDSTHLTQLFHSRKDGLCGFTLYLENIEELKQSGIKEIFLYLRVPEIDPDMSRIYEYADSTQPDIPLLPGNSLGQSFSIGEEKLLGFYLPFGTYKSLNGLTVNLDIYMLDYPITGDFIKMENIPRKPIGELCSKSYLQNSGILRKYRELFRRILNRPPNILQYSVGELFHSCYPNLSGIEIFLGSYNRENKGKLKFYIKEKGVSEYKRTMEINLSDLKNNQFKLFSFEPIPDSGDKYYYFFIESDDTYPGNAITGYTTYENHLPEGKLYLNHKPYDTDLIFKPLFNFSGTLRSDRALPELEEPFCSVSLNSSDIEDNCFTFVDLDQFNLPLNNNYYMEIYCDNSTFTNRVTLYSTSKNLYHTGLKFQERKPKGGDLLFIPVFCSEDLYYQDLLISKYILDSENDESISFDFPPVENSMNKIFSFNLATGQYVSEKLKIKTKPTNPDDEDFLITGIRSTGRSYVFESSYEKIGFFPQVMKFFDRLPTDKPNIFTRGYFIVIYAIFGFASIFVLIYLIAMFKMK